MSETPPAEPIDVHQMLWLMLSNLAEMAWVKMGLHKDPITGEQAVDLGQAKSAVDAVAALAGILEPELDADDKREVQNLVRDLRVNFVQRSQA